jgi:hypothetical protein
MLHVERRGGATRFHVHGLFLKIDSQCLSKVPRLGREVIIAKTLPTFSQCQRSYSSGLCVASHDKHSQGRAAWPAQSRSRSAANRNHSNFEARESRNTDLYISLINRGRQTSPKAPRLPIYQLQLAYRKSYKLHRATLLVRLLHGRQHLRSGNSWGLLHLLHL